MIFIRQYEKEDALAVWDLHRASIRASGADAGEGPWDNDLQNINDAYLNTGGEFLVGLLGTDIVAMGALRKSAPYRFEIKRMRVHPLHQRHGYGAAMLRALEARALQLGAATLHLDTAQAQVAAQALYQRHGYAHFGNGAVLGIPSLFYEKNVAPPHVQAEYPCSAPSSS